MYLTAHRVYNKTENKDGINAFRHVHDDGSMKDTEWDSADVVDLVSEERPGRLVDKKNELQPVGGNLVRSYLDIVAPDGTQPKDIHNALDQFEKVIQGATLPIVRKFNGVSIRFGACHGLPDGKLLQECQELRKCALSLL